MDRTDEDISLFTFVYPFHDLEILKDRKEEKVLEVSSRDFVQINQRDNDLNELTMMQSTNSSKKGEL